MEETLSEVSVKRPADTIKSILTSKAFLFVVICQTVAAVLGIIEAATNNGIFTEVLKMLEEFGAGDLSELIALSETIDTILFVIALIGLIPTLLLTAGYWLLFLSGKKQDDGLGKKGSIALFVFVSIQMVLPILELVLIFVAAIVLISLEMPIGVVVVLALVIALPVFLVYLYYSKLAGMIGGIRATLNGSRNLLKVDGYVIFCNWVVAIVNIISGFTSIASNFVGFLSAIVGSACLIIVTRMFSKYKQIEGIPTAAELEAAKREALAAKQAAISADKK